MRPITHRAALILPHLVLILVLSACATGKKSILFVTKTSYGADIDTKPPTLDIGFTRKEGTLSPVFEGGEVLPQWASFSSKAGLIQSHVGQSIAVGNAAVLLAKYIGTDKKPSYSEVNIPISEIERTKAIVEGSLGTAKRYFFGTDTSFGVRITFGLETGGYPDSLSLGWKRKELAYVPIVERPSYDVAGPNNTTQTVNRQNARLPSLIATAGLGLDTKSFESGDVRYTQFYATGLAASYLAAQPGAREAVGLKVIADPQIRQQLEEHIRKISLAKDIESVILEHFYVNNLKKSEIDTCRKKKVGDKIEVSDFIQEPQYVKQRKECFNEIFGK